MPQWEPFFVRCPTDGVVRLHTDVNQLLTCVSCGASQVLACPTVHLPGEACRPQQGHSGAELLARATPVPQLLAWVHVLAAIGTGELTCPRVLNTLRPTDGRMGVASGDSSHGSGCRGVVARSIGGFAWGRWCNGRCGLI